MSLSYFLNRQGAKAPSNRQEALGVYLAPWRLGGERVLLEVVVAVADADRHFFLALLLAVGVERGELVAREEAVEVVVLVRRLAVRAEDDDRHVPAVILAGDGVLVP